MLFPLTRIVTALARGLLLFALTVATPLLAVQPTATELQDKLDHPWSLAFLPGNNGMLITKRAGQLWQWQEGKGLSAPIEGVPAVFAKYQGCLLEVALAPDFAQSPCIYLNFAEVGDDGLC
ncbi:hypothetical protein EXD76_02790 [BEV proteobacterium]|nr:hypothetical protein [Candidatus Symbiopectobacterium sp. Chty_BC]